MIKHTAKSAFSLSLMAFLALSFTSCEKQDQPLVGASTSERRDNALIKAAQEDANARTGLRDLDLGQNWDQNLAEPAFRNGSPGSPDDGSATAESAWVVVLSTFTGSQHEQAAKTMASEVRQLDPMLADARLAASDNGSMVVAGHFTGPADPQAKQLLAHVKSITQMGRPMFRGAMLTRLRPPDAAATHPHDLRTARKLHPGRDILYSLDIATWVAEGETDAHLLAAQRAAESYASRLRAQGLPAYFFHDPDKRVSDVSVGVFGEEAYDPSSGLFSIEVQSLMKRFPERLYNGEPMRIPLHPNRPIDPKRPNSTSTLARPVLVHVPE